MFSKEYAKVVAAAGGVVGVWTKTAESLKEFGESIRAMVAAVGIDHVGIGSDTDLLSPHVGPGRRVLPRGGGDWPTVNESPSDERPARA